MAHGTGYYWNRLYKADIKNDEYAVVFAGLCYYYYEDMSDCYEPTYEWQDEYKVLVMKWRKDRYGHLVADDLSESVEVGDLTKDEANKVWWNLKNRKIRFEDVKKELEKMKKGD